MPPLAGKSDGWDEYQLSDGSKRSQANTADFHVLADGGYFLVNSQADRTFDSSIQLLQYDSLGTLVWKQKQPNGVRSLEAAIILDGLDTSKLYIEPQGILIPAP